MRDTIRKIMTAKGAGGMAQFVDACLASTRPYVQTSVLPKIKSKSI
jgi:hypothetical protein